MENDEVKEIDTYSDCGELICPYCGHVYHIDHTEDFGTDLEFDDVERECGACGETYLVSQRVWFTHETYKKENN